jgi:predicted dehydrogenase
MTHEGSLKAELQRGHLRYHKGIRMSCDRLPTRRDVLTAAGISGLAALGSGVSLAAAESPAPAPKQFRIGVVSASIRGKPQKTNGHTWHFAQYLHPELNLAAIKKYLDPGSVNFFEKLARNPQNSFDQLPFPDTRITQVYDADPASAALYAEAFPGVQVVRSLEGMVKDVDAVWLGDASGYGDDHFDLIAPGLEKGLPTFCDKPIGETVAGTRKILQFARDHKALLMSSSLYRHQWGTEQALRMRDSGEFGPLQYVICSQGGGYSETGWFIYGQHPAWMVMTLCGPGVEGVSMYARENTCHALVTYPDRMPAEIWYGRPDISQFYCQTAVHFTKQAYTYTPAIEGNYWFGHHYQMFRMAHTFRKMLQTGIEPVPHQEILEVTAMIHAAAKSLREKSRIVALSEVLG